MEVTVAHVGGLQFEAAARGHRVRCDQPRELGGADQGLTPPELLLAALGTCAGYYVGEYLRVRSLPVEGLAIRVSAEKAAQPARLSAFRIEVDAPGVSEERHRQGILRAVQKCLIHNTLLNPPRFEIQVATAEVAA